MAAGDALSGVQFARHKHPLGGPGGIEDRLRIRAGYESRNPGYASQQQMDDGAAVALVPSHVPEHWRGVPGMVQREHW